MKKIKLTMLTFICSIFICVLAFDSIAQNPYIIIGDTVSPGLTRVNLNKKQLISISNNVPDEYQIDLDNNAVNDLRITAYQGGGTGRISSYVKLSSEDNTTFPVAATLGKAFDKANVNTDTITFKTTIVKIYNLSDTLHASDPDSTLAYMTDYESYRNAEAVSWIDDWISGVHYFGIKKVLNNSIYQGWLKLEIVSHNAVYLLEYAIQQLPVGINEIHESTASLYPNPSSNLLNISGIVCKKVEIYNTLGTVVLEEENKNNSSSLSINIQNLAAGVYFTKITEQGKDGHGIKKFIKE